MSDEIEIAEAWKREMETVHGIITKIYNQPANLHGEKWRYKMLKHYWNKRNDLLLKWPEGALIPGLPVINGLISFLDRMERIDPE